MLILHYIIYSEKNQLFPENCQPDMQILLEKPVENEELFRIFQVLPDLLHIRSQEAAQANSER